VGKKKRKAKEHSTDTGVGTARNKGQNGPGKQTGASNGKKKKFTAEEITPRGTAVSGV